MKRTFLIAMSFSLCTLAFSAKTSAQDTFKKGDKVVNVGIGFGSAIGGYGTWGWETKVPPISASLDYGVVNDLFNVDKLSLGVGAYIGFTTQGYDYYLNDGVSLTCIIPGIRGIVHYGINDKFEVYGGLMLGVAIYSYDWGDLYNDLYYGYGYVKPDDSEVNMKFDGFVGARYYFTNNIGAYAELGFGIAYFNVGLSFKF